jgi:hypothetical protein
VVVQVKVELDMDVGMAAVVVGRQLLIIQQVRTVGVEESPVVEEVEEVQALQTVVEEEVVMEVVEKLGFILGKYLFLWV